ncbi:MAG: glycosyl transferase family protein, partial [Comamonas sp.]
KYLLYRDRKGLITSFIAILAYVLLAQHLVFLLLSASGLWTTFFPSTFSPHSGMLDLRWANTVALSQRILQRGYFVGRLYGWEHALLSAPRMIIGNFINAMAAARAWRLYLGYLFLGKQLVWDKTMHDFPSADQLSQQRLRLGDLLMSWRAIDEASLAKALEAQAVEHKP